MHANREYIDREFHAEFWRIPWRFMYISTFRKLALTGIEQSMTSLFIEATTQFFMSGQLGIFKEDSKAFLSRPDVQEWFVNTYVGDRIEECHAIIDSASLVFAHSIVDGSLYNDLKITSMIAPTAWEPLVIGNLARIGEVKDRAYDEILRSQIDKCLEALERESIIKKADRLFQICRPGPGFNPFVDRKQYEYSRPRLVEIDNKRHSAIHGTTLPRRMETIEDDISFLRDTAVFFWSMLNKVYGLQVDPAEAIEIAREILGQ